VGLRGLGTDEAHRPTLRAFAANHVHRQLFAGARPHDQTYQCAILKRIVRGGPVRAHTPHAADAVGRFCDLALAERVGDRLAATKAGCD
jgi:hypothetical protein